MSTDEKEEKRTTRREFIKGAAIGAAGVAAAGALAGCGPGTPAPTPEAIKETVEVTKVVEKEVPVEVTKEVEVKPWLPEKWDYEADVVIVGYGGAGAVAAITAHDAGAKVLILEKQSADNHTPSTMMSGGAFWTFKNVEDMFAFMKATSMGLTPDDCCQVFAEYAVKTLDWVKSMGGEPTGGGGITEYEVPGADAYDGYYRVPGDGRTGGENFFNFLAGNVESRGIEVLYNTPAKELVRPWKGEILGVLAESQGGEIYVKAKKAVILTCGGFGRNERMKMDYLKPYPFESYCNPGNTGDGINMALKVGAALWHMSSCGGRLICRWPDTPTGQIVGIGPPPYILVGQDGKRYTDEVPQANLHHAFLYTTMEFDWKRVRYTRDPSWCIFDEKRRLAGPFPYAAGAVALGMIPWSEDNSAEIEKGWIIKADTIGELADKIGLDRATLENTVSTFNKYCADGKDPEFHRDDPIISADGKPTLVPIDTPPYYALEMVTGVWGTQGGPMRNAKCQVLDPDGKPIPRLYSGGELGSFYGQVYQGGGDITEVIVTGQITGEHAAAEEPWA